VTTLARAKHAPHERQIAKALGLTDAQLDALLRIRQGYWPGNAAWALRKKGFAYEEQREDGWHRGLTEAGEALLQRARDMGF
jgi:hypothetical protein